MRGRLASGRPNQAAMRPGATFINTARGAIVREDELADVLIGRPDLWAVLDVLVNEPPAPEAPAGSPEGAPGAAPAPQGQ